MDESFVQRTECQDQSHWSAFKHKISKGTIQGDPLSPLIFALCIEPVEEFIRTEEKI